MIIGLIGYARSGKDTVANVLVNKFGFTRLAFADGIRNALYETNPLVGNSHRVKTVVDNYGWDEAKADPEIRRLMQAFGVAARNHISSTVWVDIVKGQLHPSRNYVITDVRFMNEVEMLKDEYAQVWRIIRPNVNAVNNHVSEHELDGYEADHTLFNDGSVEDLETLIKIRIQEAL